MSKGQLSHKGRLIILAAASGTGKTTLGQALLKRDRRIVRSISYTTRAPRKGEKHGRDYFFVSEKQFLELKRKGAFLEWANVFGRYYGTPKKEIVASMKKGKDVLLLIDVQGARQVKKIWPDATLVFLAPPSKEELRKRLTSRGTDSKAEIEKRLRIAVGEMDELNDIRLSDYRIVNRHVECAVMALQGIVAAERHCR